MLQKAELYHANRLKPMSNPLTQAYSEDSQNRETSSRSLLSAGSERFHQGMHWNGAPAYSVVGMVGKGAFAIVYKLATRSKGEIFACKELDKHKFIKNGILSHKVNNELEIMKKLDHVSCSGYDCNDFY